MLLSMDAGAQPVYKCEENGRVTYTDRPCSPRAQAATLPAVIVTAPPSRSEQALARAYDTRIAREEAERDRADGEWLKQHAQRRDHEERVRKAIIEHRVIKSMTTGEVRNALGEPDRVERGESFGTAKETWLYNDGGQTRRVNFKDGEVTTTQVASGRASSSRKRGSGGSRHRK